YDTPPGAPGSLIPGGRLSGGESNQFSPDGDQITYQRRLTPTDKEIYSSNLDGTGERNLSNHPADDDSSVWSPR
ncbi:MAG: hypothetical protein AB1758_14725, partial [Candidatus Eremiobacterota bacterium]